MKKNVIFRVAAIVVMCALVTACFASSTFARYTSSATSSTATATVAKWDVSAGDKFTNFNLFDKSGVYQLAGITQTNNASTWDDDNDANVRDGSSTAIVAPGTWGKVSFTVSNDSDVAAKYTVTFTSVATNLPLEFSTDGLKWTKASDITSSTEIATGTIAVDGADASVTLYWRWAIGSTTADDTTDTNLGTGETTPTCEIEASVVFEQVD